VALRNGIDARPPDKSPAEFAGGDRGVDALRTMTETALAAGAGVFARELAGIQSPIFRNNQKSLSNRTNPTDL
jgi:hypothetical protein